MQLETSRFGTIDVADNDVLTFTQPIIGFQEFRRFTLLPGPKGGSITWLQSVDAGDLAFLLMNPRQVSPNYQVKLGPHELAELAVDSVDALEVYTLVVVPQDRTKIRTNLRAPILVNRKQRLGKQTILDKSDYPVQFFLAQAQKGMEEPQEVANARTNA